VVQYLLDVGAEGDEGDDAHLNATDGAQQREHFLDAGNQHCPQVVHRALGWHRLSKLDLGWGGLLTPRAPSPAPVLAGSAYNCAGCTPASCASPVTAGFKGEFSARTPK
jgi:hypothetical protein